MEPIVVDKVDNAICVKRYCVDIVDVRVFFVVDVFEPVVVDKVESAICVISNVCPKVVDTLEIDNSRVDRLEPAVVDRNLTLLLINGNIPLFTDVILLLIVTTCSPIDVENVDTDVKIPVELILEKTDPHITEILDALVEAATLSSVNDGAKFVDRFDIDVERDPKDVEKFHEV